MILLAAEQCLTLLCPLLAQATFWHEVPAPCLLVTVYRDIPTLILQSTMALLLVLNSVGFFFGDKATFHVSLFRLITLSTEE